MNRPFYAIGVLLAFLAVGMLAVGLSSSSSHRPLSAGRGSGLKAPRRSTGGTVFLLAVPDPDEALAHVSADVGEGESSLLLPCEQPCYAYGCGLDRCTGQVYSLPLSRDWPKLLPAEIALAADPNSEQPANSLDCRAHYDRSYDAAVYEGQHVSGDDLLDASPVEYADDPTLKLFHSLSGRQPARATLYWRLKSARQWRLEVQQIARGMTNQMGLAAERLGLADRCRRLAEIAGPPTAPATPSWADYEAWIASLQPGVAERDTLAAETGKGMDLPWRQVLQIAVSWLNHAAKTLDSMADRLGGRGEATADDRIGIRGTADGPR